MHAYTLVLALIRSSVRTPSLVCTRTLLQQEQEHQQQNQQSVLEANGSAGGGGGHKRQGGGEIGGFPARGWNFLKK